MKEAHFPLKKYLICIKIIVLKMMTPLIDYTISSYDYNHYNRIDINLPSPPSRRVSMIVTSLTTKCSIVVIENDDYIQINGKKYVFNNMYTDLNSETFCMLLNSLIKNSNVTASVDETGRILFESDTFFTINNASYNIIQLCGIYNEILPLNSEYTGGTFSILAQSVGNYLSTPVLYLVSNVGKSSFRNLHENISISRIILRINNSFSANYPIIVTNADFEVDIPSCDLGNVQLTLVDSNMREVHLLNPIYITISVKIIEEDEE